MNSIQKEEKAITLDFLPNGYPFDKTPSHKKTPIAQAMGVTKFSLLELVPKKDVHLAPHQEVYIGEGKREEIHHINGRINISKLTGNARVELEYVIEELVTKDEPRFVDFFNKSQALSMRMHQLELLPGLGKKHMWEIIDERKGEPFISFDDIKHRVKLMPDPKKLIIKRILLELQGNEKYNLFSEK
jgi:putative nucleotide binding protein